MDSIIHLLYLYLIYLHNNIIKPNINPKEMKKQRILFGMLTIVIVHHNKLRPEMLYIYILYMCVYIKQYILLLVFLYMYIYYLHHTDVHWRYHRRRIWQNNERMVEKATRARTIISSVCHSDLSENAGTAGYNILLLLYIENIIIY